MNIGLKSIAVFILLISASTQLLSQMPADTGKVLRMEEFIQIVKVYHPIARQARLLPEEAKAGLLSAKGGFDPKLSGDWEQKFFGQKNYFTTGEYGFKIPTWYGIEVKGAFLTANGDFLNPESKLPRAGQAVLGASLQLAQGLLIDERRATLYKARIAGQALSNEQASMINDLLLEAAKAYWKWTYQHQEVQVFQQALQSAQTRYEAIKESVLQGDRPAIDTLESLIQVQDRQYELNEAIANYRNAGFTLSNFLWYENNVPLEMTDDMQPEPLRVDISDIPVDRLEEADIQNRIATHPDLKAYEFKLSQLHIDQRLKREKLKPRAELQYNLLGQGWNLGAGSDGGNILTNNYKMGIRFSMPLMLREARGEMQKAKLKILETNLQQSAKSLELRNKMRFYRNALNNAYNQLLLYGNVVNNYKTLLEAENTRFEIGESSLFLVNTRELKFIESQLKLAKLQTEFQINRVSLAWAGGQLK